MIFKDSFSISKSSLYFNEFKLFKISLFLLIYKIIKQEFIFPCLSTYRLFNNFKIFDFFSNSKDSIPPIMKQALYSHKIALYKNEVISSFDVSFAHNKIFCDIGKFFVKYLYILISSFSKFSFLYK